MNTIDKNQNNAQKMKLPVEYFYQMLQIRSFPGIS